MAIQVGGGGILKERKYPVVLIILLLLISAVVLLLTNTASTLNPTSFYPDQPLSSESIPDSSSTEDQEQEQEKEPEIVTKVTVPEPQEQTTLPQNQKKEEEDFGDDFVDSIIHWEVCKGGIGVDYMPCLDNMKAIKALRSRRHMEHRERHCPKAKLHCLLPLPKGYQVPVPWPKSRDMIWYDNVPHTKLVEYKKEQNWVVKSGDYLVFPGGGTQFKEGVDHYIEYIQKTLPAIQWGKNIRVILDVGCGVASFGGHLLDKNVLTMSFAPKDEHEAQIQFALERGIPATLSVIGTQKLPFADNGFDLLHCARCRVHWDADGGKPLFELNRILRPGGFFAWSATPVYRDDNERDKKVWQAMVSITKAMCWKVVAKAVDSNGIGLVIYQKPDSSSCYDNREENDPPICKNMDIKDKPWYALLNPCITPLPVDSNGNPQSWPLPWPQRLTAKPPSLFAVPDGGDTFYNDNKHWSDLAPVYMNSLSLNWSSVRNVMDMNAGYAGFATALIDLPVWVMNVVPIEMPDTLGIIYDKGLIGMYHDWCESFNTYPRTYDLLHSTFLLEALQKRCEIMDVVVEIDRILRPEGYLVVQDSMEMIRKLGPILRSLHWSVKLYRNQFLVAKKTFWRPQLSS